MQHHGVTLSLKMLSRLYLGTSLSDLDLTFDLAVVTLTFKILLHLWVCLLMQIRLGIFVIGPLLCDIILRENIINHLYKNLSNSIYNIFILQAKWYAQKLSILCLLGQTIN